MALAPPEVLSLGDRALEDAMDAKKLTQVWAAIPETEQL
jgi:hypothetical protein